MVFLERSVGRHGHRHIVVDRPVRFLCQCPPIMTMVWLHRNTPYIAIAQKKRPANKAAMRFLNGSDNAPHPAGRKALRVEQ
jgi:hypothetical protein